MRFQQETYIGTVGTTGQDNGGLKKWFTLVDISDLVLEKRTSNIKFFK